MAVEVVVHLLQLGDRYVGLIVCAWVADGESVRR